MITFQYRRLLSLAVICVFGVAQAASAFADADIPRVATDGNSVIIKNWLLVGPFRKPGKRTELWKEEFIDIQGISSADKPMDTLASKVQEWNESSGFGEEDRARVLEAGGGEVLDFQQVLGRPYVKGPIACIYAIACLDAPRDMEATALLGSSDSSKAWLNGTKVLDVSERRGLELYNDTFPLRLRKGRNILVVNVGRWNIAWSLTLRIEADTSAATAAALQYAPRIDLFAHPVAGTGEQFFFAPSAVPAGARVPVHVRRPSGDIAWQGELVAQKQCAELKTLEPGAYRVELDEPHGRLATDIFVGNRATGDRLFEKAAAARDTTNDEWEKNQLLGLGKRMKAVTNPEAKQSETLHEARFAHAAFELETVLAHLGEGKDRFLGSSTGVRLYSFHSDIDDRIQTTLFRPQMQGDAPDRTAPIVVMLHTVISANRPFETSVLANDFIGNEKLAALAAQNGVSIFWSGYRARPAGNIYEINHLLEGLRNVCKDFQLKPRGIYLLGACSGGAIATQINLNVARRFDGVALLNPVLTLKKRVDRKLAYDFIRNEDFISWATLNSWDSEYAEARVPTLIVHDGAEPGHGSIETASRFAQKLQQSETEGGLFQLGQPLADHFAAWGAMFAWVKQRAGTSSTEAWTDKDLKAVDWKNYPGFTDSLSRRFILVKPTGGTAQEAKSARAWADKFSGQWKTSNFSEPLLVDDVNFSDQHRTADTVILIGNAQTNHQWSAYAKTRNVSFSPGSLSCPEGTWSGDRLGAILVTKDESTEKRVIFVCLPDEGTAPAFDASLEGWFSFLVWSGAGERPAIIYARR